MARKIKKFFLVILVLALAAAAGYAYTRWGELSKLWDARPWKTQSAPLSAPVQPISGEAATPAQPEEAPGVAILLTVVHGDGSRKDFSIATKELNLRRILEQERLIAGVESDWGLYILTVDGETADQNLQQWWRLTLDGAMLESSVDNTVIAGGEHFTFTLINPGETNGADPASVTITLTVIHKDESEKVFTITTKETTLRAALEQAGLIEGTEGDYGLYIFTVDGESIHESHHDWWRLTKNGELTDLGVDHIQIADGDRYELTFIAGVY